MITKKILLLLVAAVSMFAVACGGKVVVDDEHTFSGDKWQSFEPQRFEFDIKDADDYYDIYFTAVIDTARYRENELPLAVQLNGASGERRTFRYDMVVRDRNGWIGEYKEGLLYSKRCIRRCFSFNGTGRFSLELKQITSRYELQGIHAIEVYIERAKLDYPN